MALPKRPAEGANPRFRSVGPNGDNRDPTQKPPPVGGVRNPSTERWSQIDPGETDRSGAYHDW